MYEYDNYYIFLIIFHIIETSILTTLFYKVALGKREISKSFYLKILILTSVIKLIYLLFHLIVNANNNMLISLYFILILPFCLFLFTLYYNKLIIVSRNGYEYYLWEKSIWITFLVLVIIFFQVSLFISFRLPTIVLLINFLSKLV